MSAAISPASMCAQLAPAAQVGLWVAALIALSIGVFLVMSWLRGRWLDGGRRDSNPASLSLDQIHRLHSAGAISDAERDALRARALAQVGAGVAAERRSAAFEQREHSNAVMRAPPGYDLTGEALPASSLRRARGEGAGLSESEGT